MKLPKPHKMKLLFVGDDALGVPFCHKNKYVCIAYKYPQISLFFVLLQVIFIVIQVLRTFLCRDAGGVVPYRINRQQTSEIMIFM